jgi:hypothetical protein
MQLKSKYIIGTHVMFFEVDMVGELIQSIVNAVNTVDNKENVTVEMFFNISEYFEKIDTSKISKEQLIEKFKEALVPLKETGADIREVIYDENKPYAQIDYRRDLNYHNCTEYDYLIWGESDCLLPAEMFSALETIKQYAEANNIHRYVTTFAVRKMWDDSWKVLEHKEFTDKPYHSPKTEPELALKMPYSIRYNMSIEEMNEINKRAEEFDIQVLNFPKFDGSGLVLTGDLIKNNVNVPKCIVGHQVDDTSMMSSCARMMGNAYVQFVIKNVLKVHNRDHKKKRLYALDMDRESTLDIDRGARDSNWFKELNAIAKKNLSSFGPSQNKYEGYKEFEKMFKVVDES